MQKEQLQFEFLDSEISNVNRKLTYCPTRCFKMKHVGEILIHQDIAFTGGTVWDSSVVCGHFLESLGPRSVYHHVFGTIVLRGTVDTSLTSMF